MKKRLARFFDWAKKNKKVLLVSSTILVVFLGILITAIWLKNSKEVSRTDPNATSTSEPTIKLEKSPLTGVEVSPDLAKRPVKGIVIENSPDARPQSGLQEAGVVFEAIAEGGITRHLALYQEARPALFGPVRSLRPYFLEWGKTFDAAVAHVGGSPEALQYARSASMKDLDQFSHAGSFYRASDRYAPHNMYTTSDLLDALMNELGFQESKFTPWTRKADTPSPAPNASNISINISSQYYASSYTYDQASNSYLRSLAGNAHKDRESGKQINPKVVIVMKIPQSVMADGHLKMPTAGSGELLIFQDGTLTTGTWQKPGAFEQYKFLDAAGAEISLNAGQAWVVALPPEKSVTYN
ncbi:DUF3048 domain-containing protein [Candidatus Saccharibacteria bacterium CPR2]|nr:DUF3048 domain-containing protein [Candidatus Saccharibacteria bacterium CPR2]